MTDERSTRCRIGRRTALRRVAALSTAALGTAAVGAAAEPTTLTFEADASRIDGLASAAIHVDVADDATHVRHEYDWDREVLRELDRLQCAAMHLDLPTDLGSADPAEIVERTELEDATAVLEDPSGVSVPDGDRTTDEDGWDVIPYVETNSLMCGTLAESNLRIRHTPESPGRAEYDAANLEAITHDYACEDEWYVSEEFDTVWHEDGRELQRRPESIDATATYYNDDFPCSDRVWADHCFEITPEHHHMRYEHSGDRSRLLLEARSETGYRE